MRHSALDFAARVWVELGIGFGPFVFQSRPGRTCMPWAAGRVSQDGHLIEAESGRDRAILGDAGKDARNGASWSLQSAQVK